MRIVTSGKAQVKKCGPNVDGSSIKSTAIVLWRVTEQLRNVLKCKKAESGSAKLFSFPVATDSVQLKDQTIIPSNKTGLNGF